MRCDQHRRSTWGLTFIVPALTTILAAAPAGYAKNLVKNGDFSLGTAQWEWRRVSGWPDFSTLSEKACLPNQSGNPYLAVNTYWGAIGEIEQPVALPDKSCTLSFRTWGHLDPVTASVIIVDQSGAEHVLETFTPPITEWSPDPYDTSIPLQCTGNTDIRKAYDLSTYKNQNVLLRFRSTSNGTNGTFADFDDVVIEAPEPSLTATLAATPKTVRTGDLIRVDMTAENTGQPDLTDVAPKGGLQTAGTAVVELASGPQPASAAKLTSGHKEIFTYTYTVKAPGCITFTGAAQGRDSSDPVESASADSNKVRVNPIVRVTKITCTEPDNQITPADKIELKLHLEKLCDVDVQGLKVTIGGGLIQTTPDPIVVETAPSGTGGFDVTASAKVADETDGDILTYVIPGGASGLPLDDSRITAILTWTEAGETITETQSVSVSKDDGSTWSVTYPDYSPLTGDPPTVTLEPAKEADYYRRGPLVMSPKGDGGYLIDPVVRKWALHGARYHTPDDATPDTAGEAAEALGQYLSENVPFDWTKGEIFSRPIELATKFEAHAKPAPHACVGKALAFGGFARVLGIRVRETNNAIRFEKLTGSIWAQHATDQVWHNGAWQWYDITLTGVNQGKVVHDYPDAYFRQGFGTAVFSLRYRQIRTWFAWDPKLVPGTDFQLVGQEHGQETRIGEIGIPDRWQLFADITSTPEQFQQGLHFQAHSPCTMLYTDAQGRRMGAVGALTAADFVSIDSVLPLAGSGSVWEIPGAIYLAPGTPIPLNGSDPNAMQYLEEEIIIPPDQITATFSVLVTGTGEGPYRIDVVSGTPDSPQQLATYSGTIAAGETYRLTFTADASDATPAATLTEAVRVDGSDTALDEPLTGCGAGACGAGTATAMCLTILGAGGATVARRRSRRRQC